MKKLHFPFCIAAAFLALTMTSPPSFSATLGDIKSDLGNNQIIRQETSVSGAQTNSVSVGTTGSFIRTRMPRRLRKSSIN